VSSAPHHEEDEEYDGEDEHDGNDDDDDDGPDGESSAVLVVEAGASDGIREGAVAGVGLLVVGQAVGVATGVGSVRCGGAPCSGQAGLEGNILGCARIIVKASLAVEGS